MALAFSALWAACHSGDLGSKVDQARTAYQQGRLAEAEQLFEDALEAEPQNVAALVGLVDIHLDRDELDEAAARLRTLDEVQLDRRGEQLVERTRGRYYRMLYEQSRGQGPGHPADPRDYEESLIALFNLEARPQQNDELAQLFAIQARQALGAPDPEQPLAPDSACVGEASQDQLEAALVRYRRFTERDPRLTRVLNPPAVVQSEAEAMVPALERLVFQRQLDARFQTEIRPALLEQGRFDPDANAILIDFTSPEPYDGERPEGEALDAFRQELALTLTVEELTGLAYQLRGTPRTEDRPIQLGRNPAEVVQAYSGVEVLQFEFPRSGIVTMQLRVPYELLPETAWRLEQYLTWRAAHPSGEGTGEASGMESVPGIERLPEALPTVQGSGEGTGRPEGSSD